MSRTQWRLLYAIPCFYLMCGITFIALLFLAPRKTVWAATATALVLTAIGVQLAGRDHTPQTEPQIHMALNASAAGGHDRVAAGKPLMSPATLLPP